MVGNSLAVVLYGGGGGAIFLQFKGEILIFLKDGAAEETSDCLIKVHVPCV